MLQKTFPSPETLRRFPFGLSDVVVTLGTLVLLGVIAYISQGTLVPFVPPDTIPSISLDPHYLPYYAGRSTLRMFIALFCSTVFTLVYGYVAARNRYAERIMVPLLDILQSVPVLGFLSITVTGFIALFPGSLLGLEAASIFAIFTSQAWNMTFSFYQSLKMVPHELDEAATLYQFTGWQRFTQLELPNATIALLWNAMMSFGGGWFFVAVSENISVLNQKYTLPGIGSYVAAAVAAKDLSALGWAFLTIIVVIVLVERLFWRPLNAWAQKFRLEQSAATAATESWLLDLLKAARLLRLMCRFFTPIGEIFNRFMSFLTPPESFQALETTGQQWSDRIYNLILLLLVGALLVTGVHFILATVGLSEIFKTFLLGLLTLGRVLIVLVMGTLIWTPAGVAIGFNPKLASLLQPVVQFLASFPANFIFPFATLFFIRANISLDWGSILLMSLGAQWYILFNAIAGAMSVPTDLREISNITILFLVTMHALKRYYKPTYLFYNYIFQIFTFS
ncbi:ABC transporter permease subunit [Scytonema sp. NUACC21]